MVDRRPLLQMEEEEGEGEEAAGLLFGAGRSFLQQSTSSFALEMSTVVDGSSSLSASSSRGVGGSGGSRLLDVTGMHVMFVAGEEDGGRHATADGGNGGGGEGGASGDRRPPLPLPAQQSSSASSSSGGAGGVVAQKKLGLWLGVYVPTLLSMFGALTFLRLGWGVGQVGVLGMVWIFSVAGLVVVLTALSMCAIVTNGRMKSGGVYYLVSRSLGPEFGATVGVIFWLAHAASIAFNIAAFAESITLTFFSPQAAASYWVQTLTCSVALVSCLAITLSGAQVFSRVYVYILLVLLLAMASTAISLLSPSAAAHPPPSGYVGASGAVLSSNLLHRAVPPLSFWSVFAIIFPALTGMTAGSNMSGDLRDPKAHIGPGTLWAIGTCWLLYVMLCTLLGAAITPEGLLNNLNIMQESCFSKWAVVFGVWSTTFSSALGAMGGAGRILQALSRDEVVPGMGRLAVGRAGDDEPINATLVSWATSQLIVLLGSFNRIASVITNFYLMTYMMINAACFTLSVLSTPNFRPSFKYFSWRTALLGALLSLASMFLSNGGLAVLACLLMAALFLLITRAAGNGSGGSQGGGPWGDVSQAIIFHQVRKYLLRLDVRGQQHPKFWRPSVLLMLWRPHHHAHPPALNLARWCNSLKKGGLYIIADIATPPPATTTTTTAAASSTTKGSSKAQTSTGGVCVAVKLRDAWVAMVEALQLKAFVQVALGGAGGGDGDVSVAVNLVMSAGLGGLDLNTIVIPIEHHMHMHHHQENGAEPPPPGHQQHHQDDDPFHSASSPPWGYQVVEPCAVGAYQRLEAAYARQPPPPGQRGEEEGGACCRGLLGLVGSCLGLGKNVCLTRNFEALDLQGLARVASYHNSRRRGEGGSSSSSSSAFIRKDKLFIDVWVSMDQTAAFASSRGHDDGGGGSSSSSSMRWGAKDPPHPPNSYHHRKRGEGEEEGGRGHEGEEEEESRWLAGDASAALCLQLQLAHVLHRSDVWEDATELRVVAVTRGSGSQELEGIRRELVRLLRLIRIEALVIVLTVKDRLMATNDNNHTNTPPTTTPTASPPPPTSAAATDADSSNSSSGSVVGSVVVSAPPRGLYRAALLHSLMREHCGATAMLFLALPDQPPPPSSTSGSSYVREVLKLTNGLPPCALVWPAAAGARILTTAI